MIKDSKTSYVPQLNDAISFSAIRMPSIIDEYYVVTARCLGSIDGVPIVRWQGRDQLIHVGCAKVGVYEKRWFTSGDLDSHWKLVRQ